MTNTLSRTMHLATIASVVFCSAAHCSGQPETMADPPHVDQRPVRTTLFGDERTDEYAWMRNVEDPAVIEHLRRENAYTDAVLEPLEPLRDRIHREMLDRLPPIDQRPPIRYGSWEYYERFEAGLDYPTFCRRPIGHTDEHVLLDVNALAHGAEYYAVTAKDVSPDHRTVAFIEERNGDDVGALRFRSLDGRTTSPDVSIEGVWAHCLAWDAAADAVYYVRTDDTQRPATAWRHRIGTDPADDELLYESSDGRFAVDVYRCRSDEFVIIHSYSDDASHVLAVDARDPDAPARTIFPHRECVSAKQIEHRRGDDGGWFYAIDNANGAVDGRLVRREIGGDADSPWKVVLPEEPGVSLRNLVILEEWLALEERRNGYRVIRVMRHDRSDEHVIDVCPTPGWTTLEQGPEYGASTIRVETSAPLEELTTYEYDPERRAAKFVYQRASDFDASSFSVETIFGVAPDGVRIPMTVIFRRDNPRDGSSPALLTGYGAVGAVMEPGFYPTRTYASLLERGVTIAVAHVRGGGFYGPRWHHQGRLERKPVTFSDFVACAEALFKEGLATPDRLALTGGSAGGLLVAAAINLRPDIARVVVAEVPFVDCLNSMLDPTLPATTLDYPEMGNPDEERYYRAIRSYAPYENVGPRDYPDILATGGISDARVAFWEPAKWVARLRERRLDADDGLTLLRMNLGAGHGGSSGRRDALLDRAELQAFMLDRLGLGDADPRAFE